MKRSRLASLFWVLSASVLWAQQPLADDQRWVEQVDVSIALPSFRTPVAPDPGPGGDINLGYRFDRTWAIFFGTGYYQYNIPPSSPATSALLAYIPLVLILRTTLGDGPIRPYLFGGAGFALNTYSQINGPGDPIREVDRAETDLYLAPGVGVLYRFSSDMAVFLQTRIDIDFTSQNNLGIPLGNPSVFIPIQAGISFFTL